MGDDTITNGGVRAGSLRAWLAELARACHDAARAAVRPGGVLDRLTALARHREIFVLVHLCLIGVAWYFAFLLRFDGSVPDRELEAFAETLPWVLVVHALLFESLGLNRGIWRYAGLWDAARILSALLVGMVISYVVVFQVLGIVSFPRSVLLLAALLQAFLVGGVRLAVRMWRELRPARTGKRILIVGAGDAGEMIARDLLRHHYDPVGFVDDDPAKTGKRIHGAKVLGARIDLPRIIASTRPQEVLLAIPSATPNVLREFVRALEPFKIPITTLPRRQELTDGRVAVHQMRRLAIEDLLARAPIGLDPAPLSALVRGRSMLVTGAGGSIGSELCRQLAALQPSSLVLFERYENSLYSLVNDLEARGYRSMIRIAVGDVCDGARVAQVLSAYQPAVVFHAAAHKHVPLMELAPCEAIKNNVIGTSTVARAAAAAGVERFVLISTDKAVNPSSMMGATKRVAELVVRRLASSTGTRFLAVRFGNVLASNGSVVPRWLEQIEAGGPVTVTHPEIERYFMLIPEAVQLVLHATTLARGGEIFVLDMGAQVKLADMARHLITLSGFVPDEEIKLAFTGLRPGEKLSEELVGAGEEVEPSATPKIMRVTARQWAAGDVIDGKVATLVRYALAGDVPQLVRALQELVPTYRPGHELLPAVALHRVPAVPKILRVELPAPAAQPPQHRHVAVP